ncbi:protein kinase [Streptomyces yaizuensis]
MHDYAGRVLADRYRLPLPPSDEYELVETRAFDTYSGQEVLVRQVPLPEVVEAEVVDGGRIPGPAGAPAPPRDRGRGVRRPTDPAVLRAVEAAQAAAAIPDHPRLDQVFDVFAEAGSLWIVSERVAARPLAALLAEQPLTPYRAAEVASDVLTALRVLHAHGWTHRNITARTVLVCDDGRIVLTGLAEGAAEEALCGYAPVPTAPPEGMADELPLYDDGDGDEGPYGYDTEHSGGAGEADEDGEDGEYADDDGDGAEYDDGEYAEYEEEYEEHADGADGDEDAYAGAPGYGDDAYGYGDQTGGADDEGGEGGAGGDRYAGYGDDDTDGGGYGGHGPGPVRPYGDDRGGPGDAPDTRAARAGAIAAYRAGARAGAQAAGAEDRAGSPVQTGADPDWWARRPGEDTSGPVPRAAFLPGDDGGPGGGGRSTGFDGRDDAGDRYGDPYSDDDGGDDDGEDGAGAGFGADGGAGPARLAGTWHDGPFPGQDGPRALPAGGGTGAGGLRPLPPPGRPLPLPEGFGPATTPPPAPGWTSDAHPHRNSDPYGVRRQPPAAPAGDRPALPPARSGAASPPPDRGRGGAGPDALRADARRQQWPVPAPASEPPPPSGGGWDGPAAPPGASGYRGPATPLAAERARQARIAVVGAVTERWAPEQAGPVHENWQLAAPVGPATDLWALGALLYRSVQGHAPYPEDSAAELVQLVCSEPPAFAEECGPLRPVVESLLRQDPTERPDFEELRGWLRSLVRSAPEPEAGAAVVAVPPAPVEGSRLPVVRRRGELVRKRRSGSTEVVHGRHRHKKTKERAPGALGRTLLLLVLALLGGAVAYAVFFLPGAQERAGSGTRESAGPSPGASREPDAPAEGTEGDTTPAAPSPDGPSRTSGSEQQTSEPAGDPPAGYTLRRDPEGFSVAVDSSWQRRPINDSGQIRYSDGDFTLIVVPGRDSVQAGGGDPLVYQRDAQRELQPYRDSSWAEASGLRRIQIGRRVMAEGQFTWQDATGRQVFVRNLVSVIDGRYHVVQVIGPEERRDEVTEAYRAAADSYRSDG